jgi:hypothetical protein
MIPTEALLVFRSNITVELWGPFAFLGPMSFPEVPSAACLNRRSADQAALCWFWEILGALHAFHFFFAEAKGSSTANLLHSGACICAPVT